jgi:hypothetical protein
MTIVTFAGMTIVTFAGMTIRCFRENDDPLLSLG